MKRLHIGELEEIILLVVGNLSSDAYGINIRDELRIKCNRNMSISTIHTTLHRLEKKGFLTSTYVMSGETRRAGRPKLVFSISAQGREVLEQVHQLRNDLWKSWITSLEFRLILSPRGS